jgi:hypothetical protein
MTTGKVVGRIFLAADKLFRMEKLTVSTSPYLVNDSRLQIYKNSAGNMLSGSSFAEESVECIVSATDSFVAGHLAIRLNAVLEAVKFPASISNLDTGLSNVDRDALSHFRWGRRKRNPKKKRKTAKKRRT